MSFTAVGSAKASTRVRQSKFSDFALSSFLACILAAGPSAYALPAGGVVTDGSGSISQAGAVTTINQSSARLGLNWNSFNIGAAETVNFVQPSASSVAVNRIHDVNGTQILGKLNANGQVFLINPNGVLFGAGSQVNVGGLVASTLDLAADGKTFSGAGGSVVNQGSLTAADGGYIALLGGSVSNQGTITARLGTVALGAGNQVTLDFSGDQLVSLSVDSNTVAALAENKQLIRADGGVVLMSAGARDSLVASVVNNTGVVQAQTIENRGGVIKLLGGMKAGTTTVAGTLDASAPVAGDGGFIETSAATVTVADSAKITTRAASGKTGTWLIDPTDFTIAASGGDITGTDLSTQLADNNVALEAASGNLNVNDAVSWSADTTLTLTALLGSIIFNAPLTATGDHAGLVLSYGMGAGYTLNGHAITLSGATPTLQIGETGSLVTYTVINNLGAEGSTTGTDLQGMNGGLAGHYALGSDINASATAGWNGGAGFSPLAAFAGSFTGLGHTVNGLTINQPASGNIGLFRQVSVGGLVRDVGLMDVSINGASKVGGLVGYNSGTITNAYATGSVSGSGSYVGGLVGYNGGTITNAYATDAVSGTGENIGGLVGFNDGGTITNAYATGSVSGSKYSVGGLVGYNKSGTITNACATGSVSGNADVGGLVGYNSGAITNAYATGSVSRSSNFLGGLVGYNNGGTITNAYATGSVSGSNDYVGGLVGTSNGGTITNAYATGAVSGNSNVGGLVGTSNGGTITNAYATGAVSGDTNVGGLVGSNAGSITSSYWDTETTGQAHATGGGDIDGITGLTTSEAFYSLNYGDFDFLNTWFMLDGETRPFLRSEYSTNITNAHQLQLIALDPTASYTLGADIDASATAVAVKGTNPSVLWTSSGFSPLGGGDFAFTGTLDGQGHTISNLAIKRHEGGSGFFNAIKGGTVRNLRLSDVYITGGDNVGGLSSVVAGATLDNVSVSGMVSGHENVGGLIGTTDESTTLSRAFFDGTVIGATNVGGLIGLNLGAISDSYAVGLVRAQDNAGGLVGNLAESAGIRNSYAAVRVVSDGGNSGAVVGFNQGNLKYTYWDSSVSTVTRAVGTGSNSGTTELQGSDARYNYNYNGFDFSDVWFIAENGGSRPMLRAEYSTTLRTVNQFILVQLDLGADYTLANDLDFRDIGQLLSFGYEGTPFTGTFQGAGHTLNGLTYYNGGIFTELGSGATVKNLHLTDLVVRADTEENIGGLAGMATGATIANVSVSGAVTGGDVVGGLIGFASLDTTISDSTSSVRVIGENSVGGIVGATGDFVSLTRTSATGSVTGKNNVGGLVGSANSRADITQSYSTATVRGRDNVGGLVGYDSASPISESYVTGSVYGSGQAVGGLVGRNNAPATITAAYAIGSVTGGNNVGGLVGDNSAHLSQVYASGAVSLIGAPAGDTSIGGIVGLNFATFDHVFWDTETTQQSGAVGSLSKESATGLTTEQAHHKASYTDLDFDSTWVIFEGSTRPFLRSEYSTTITNDHQLQLMAVDLTASYTLANNIDASATAGANASGMWTTAGFVPVGTLMDTFTGMLDGKGCIITGLTINRPDSDNVGLFGFIEGSAVVQNIGLINNLIVGGSTVGGLVGFSSSGTITNAYATGSVSGSGDYVGGLVGYNDSGAITNAYATGSVSGSGDSVGGLVGVNYGAITNAYATDLVSGNNYVGDLVGLNNGTITSAYATGSVSGHDYVGGLVGFNGGTITAGYWDTETTGQSASVGFGDTSGTTGLTTSAAFTQSSYGNFDFKNTWFMVDGQTRPFLRSEYSTTINNDHQLQLMAMDLTADYTLGRNINASATAGTNASDMWSSRGFSPIGVDGEGFSGDFLGQNNRIDGLTINRLDTEYVGLFRGIGISQIRDLGLTNVAIFGANSTGALAASLYLGTVSNVYVTGQVTATGSSVGGLIGFTDYGIITNSYSTAHVIGRGNLGGLVGYSNQGEFTNVYATGDVSIDGIEGDGFGGLVGSLSGGSINGAYSTGAVIGNAEVGGLVGKNSGTITNAYHSEGTVSGAYAVGGLVGFNLGDVVNTYSTVPVLPTTDAENPLIGALVGRNTDGGGFYNSYWDATTSNLNYGAGGNLTPKGMSALTTAEFQDTNYFGKIASRGGRDTGAPSKIRKFFGWDFLDTWAPSSDGHYPELYALTPVIFAVARTIELTYGDDIPAFYPDDIFVYGGAAHYVFGTRGDTTPISIGELSTTATSTSDVGHYPLVLTASDSIDSTLGDEYRVLALNGDIIIRPRALTLTPTVTTKIYGDATPAIDYILSSGKLIGSDTLTGALALADGAVNVGTYGFTPGTLTAGSNYSLSLGDVRFQITARPITVTADSATITKGNDLPALTYVVTTGNLVPGDGDSLNGLLATEATKESPAGDYAITQGDLAAGANYEITFVDGVLTLKAPANTSTSQVAIQEQQHQPGDGQGRGGISLGGFESQGPGNLALQILGMTLPGGVENDDENQ